LFFSFFFSPPSFFLLSPFFLHALHAERSAQRRALPRRPPSQRHHRPPPALPLVRPCSPSHRSRRRTPLGRLVPRARRSRPLHAELGAPSHPAPPPPLAPTLCAACRPTALHATAQRRLERHRRPRAIKARP
jgi:hypothetical protein